MVENKKIANQKVKILIVDDDHVCLEAIKQLLLSHYQCEVDAVDSAEKALNRVNEMELQWQPKWYDLIFMDINMPILKGDLVTKIIKAESKMEKIPVIAITGQETAINEKLFFDRGIVEIIIKPITVEKLNTVMRKYLCINTER
jgi:two-component system sensor histidine kinase/response regulator